MEVLEVKLDTSARDTFVLARSALPLSLSLRFFLALPQIVWCVWKATEVEKYLVKSSCEQLTMVAS